MQKKALVTGCMGQDGSYLTELLLEKGYRVFGMDCIEPGARMAKLMEGGDFLFLDGDLKNAERVKQIVRTVQPDELYNLGAQSYVPASWCNIIDILDINAMGVARLLEAIRLHSPETRFFQASSAEMFGRTDGPVQDESTCHHPRSPYGCSKSFSFNLTRNYREAFGVFGCNGIMYNHESVLRGLQFVTRKITNAAAGISLGKMENVALGNLDAKRDWGFAPDYVRAMWMMLQHRKADDYVVATGKMHSVRELAEKAFAAAGMGLVWTGKGLNERGVEKRSGRTVLEVSREFFRPADIEQQRGDFGKIRRALGWKPGVNFDRMIKMMVENDIASFSQGTIK
jgi:GDPmannose 4,6-dehydratase